MVGSSLLRFAAFRVDDDGLREVLSSILSDPQPGSCFFKPVHGEILDDVLRLVAPRFFFIPIQESRFALLIMKLFRQLPVGK